MSMPDSRGVRRQNNQPGGFSLVELLVSLAIGLLIVSGLTVLFVNSSQSGSELDKSVRQIESGRYAMEVMSDDIRLAGFYY